MCDPVSIGTAISAAVAVYSADQQRRASNKQLDLARKSLIDPAAEAKAATEAANRAAAEKRRRRLSAVLDPGAGDPLGGSGGSAAAAGRTNPFLASGSNSVLGGAAKGYGYTGALAYGS